MAATFPLKISTPQVEGIPSFAKWIHLPLLLSLREMEEFVSFAADWYPLGRIASKDEVFSAKDNFLLAYQKRIQSIQEGTMPNDHWTYAVTVEEEALYAMSVREGQYNVRPKKPFIQIKTHQFAFSEKGDLLQNAIGKETKPWGVQISFPFVYQDPKTVTVHKSEGENVLLFRSLQKWVRHHTKPYQKSALRIGEVSL